MTAAAVLKKNVVRSAGRAEAPRQSPAVQSGGASMPPRGGQAKASIVEHTNGRVLIQVTCPCGETTYLECEYKQPEAGQ
ncbi:MAG: hypothetical protein ACOC93_01270 [Planctomycetota bacterium]